MQVTLDRRGPAGNWSDVHVVGDPNLEDGPIAKVYLNDYRKHGASPLRLILAEEIRAAVERTLTRGAWNETFDQHEPGGGDQPVRLTGALMLNGSELVALGDLLNEAVGRVDLSAPRRQALDSILAKVRTGVPPTGTEPDMTNEERASWRAVGTDLLAWADRMGAWGAAPWAALRVMMGQGAQRVGDESEPVDPVDVELIGLCATNEGDMYPTWVRLARRGDPSARGDVEAAWHVAVKRYMRRLSRERPSRYEGSQNSATVAQAAGWLAGYYIQHLREQTPIRYRVSLSVRPENSLGDFIERRSYLLDAVSRDEAQTKGIAMAREDGFESRSVDAVPWPKP